MRQFFKLQIAKEKSNMADRKTIFNDVPDSRRRIMRSIKGSETKPEKLLRGILQKLGYRFQKNVKSLPGKPDIVFSAKKKVIFVHGCFWHAHSACRPISIIPKVRSEYWKEKFYKTIQRDEKTLEALSKAGWSTLVVWECELKNLGLTIEKLVSFLGRTKNN